MTYEQLKQWHVFPEKIPGYSGQSTDLTVSIGITFYRRSSIKVLIADLRLGQPDTSKCSWIYSALVQYKASLRYSIIFEPLTVNVAHLFGVLLMHVESVGRRHGKIHVHSIPTDLARLIKSSGLFSWYQIYPYWQICWPVSNKNCGAEMPNIGLRYSEVISVRLRTNDCSHNSFNKNFCLLMLSVYVKISQYVIITFF